MEKKSYTVAIDLGSSNVVVAVGSKREDGTLGIEAVVSKPVEGVKAGRIDNIEQAGNAIREAVAEVESTLGVRITEAYAGISGEFVRCARHTDHVFTYDPQNGVNQGDVDALFDRMRNVQAPDDETIMERIPQHYMVDDAEEVRNPVGSFCKVVFDFQLHTLRQDAAATARHGSPAARYPYVGGIPQCAGDARSRTLFR